MLGFAFLCVFTDSAGIHHHEKPPFGEYFCHFFQPPNKQVYEKDKKPFWVVLIVTSKGLQRGLTTNRHSFLNEVGLGHLALAHSQKSSKILRGSSIRMQFAMTVSKCIFQGCLFRNAELVLATELPVDESYLL